MGRRQLGPFIFPALLLVCRRSWATGGHIPAQLLDQSRSQITIKPQLLTSSSCPAASSLSASLELPWLR